MLKKLKHTLKQTLIYSIGNISTKLIGFVLLPLYTSHLATSEYGLFALLEVTSTIMVSIFGLKLATAVMRWNSNISCEKKQKSIVYTAFLFTFTITVLIVTSGILYSDHISSIFLDTPDYQNLLIILFISVGFQIINQFPMELIRLKEKPVFFIILTILRFSIVLILNIVFITEYNMGVKGILLSILFGNIFIFIATVKFLLANMIPKLDFSELKSMLSYSIPLVFSTISMMVLTMSDRYILKYKLELSEVGVYSLGFKIASVINIFVIQSFQKGFLPIAYKMYKKTEARRFFSKTLTYYVFVLSLAGLFISMFSKELIELLSRNTEYNIAYTIIPILSFSFVFQGIRYVFSLGLHFVKKTKYNAYIVMVAAIINVIMNLILIPIINIYGAAISLLFSQILMSIMFYFYSQKHYYIEYEINKIFKIIFLMIAFLIFVYFISKLSLIYNVFIKIFAFFSFPIILYFLGFFDEIEL